MVARNDFTLNISYNKILEVKDGVCTLNFNSTSSPQTWVMERQMVMAMMQLRPALESSIGKEKTAHFSVLEKHNIRTAYLAFRESGENKYMIFFSCKKDPITGKPYQQLVMTPEKFALLMDGLQCFVDGRTPINAITSTVNVGDAVLSDYGGDLDELYRLTLVILFSNHVLAALQGMCYGCNNKRASQKDHNHCLEGTELEASDSVFQNFISRHRVIMTTLVAFRCWMENAGLRMEGKFENALAYLSSKIGNLPYDYDAVLKTRCEIERREIDPGKLEVVKMVDKLMESE